MSENTLETDVLIIGAGPAGLSCAIRLAQLAKEQSSSQSIMVLEKGAEVGAHILSGAVFDPRALTQLFPQWKTQGAPLSVPVQRDRFYALSAKHAWRLPTPSALKNHGNYIISLGQLCKWLATQAEALGVDIFPGFSAKELLLDAKGDVCGVMTQAAGLNSAGEPMGDHVPGLEIKAKHTIIAEGCRGSLAQKCIRRYRLQAPGQFQTYGLGFKEIWEVDSPLWQSGTVVHTVGHPFKQQPYGGGFIYHADQNRVYVGLVVGLDYENPYLSPYDAFQRFKHHPKVAAMLKGGRLLRYGARTLNEGGWQSIPKMSFPGGMLIGCSAGLLNVARIKGSHTAMGSGILAAEHLFTQNKNDFTTTIKKSWIGKELYRARNIRPGFKKGRSMGMALAALDQFVLRGQAPWTWKHSIPDHACLRPKSQFPFEEPFIPDGKISFDKLTAVSYSNTFHRDNQVKHLHLRTPSIANEVNLALYGGPECHYCPAGVYEYVKTEKGLTLQINAQNCLHCKACDIKDPTQNIEWTPPEGGGGPNYGDM